MYRLYSIYHLQGDTGEMKITFELVFDIMVISDYLISYTIFNYCQKSLHSKNTTVCIRDLDLTLVKEVKRLFLGHLSQLYKRGSSGISKN